MKRQQTRVVVETWRGLHAQWRLCMLTFVCHPLKYAHHRAAPVCQFCQHAATRTHTQCCSACSLPNKSVGARTASRHLRNHSMFAASQNTPWWFPPSAHHTTQHCTTLHTPHHATLHHTTPHLADVCYFDQVGVVQGFVRLHHSGQVLQEDLVLDPVHGQHTLAIVGCRCAGEKAGKREEYGGAGRGSGSLMLALGFRRGTDPGALLQEV